MTENEIASGIEQLPARRRFVFTAEQFGKAYSAYFVDLIARVFPKTKKTVRGHPWAYWIGHVVQFLPLLFIVGICGVLFQRG